MRKTIWVISSIIVVLILLLGAFFLFKQKDTSESPINNWKTYQNNEFGYSFKYPERFSVITPLAQGYIGGNILVDPDKSYITIYVVTTPHPPLNRPADINIDGYPAVLTPPFGEYRSGISIYQGDNLINIYLTNLNNKIDENSDKLIRDIISTIKLTN